MIIPGITAIPCSHLPDKKGTRMQVTDAAMSVIDLPFNYERDNMERSLLHGK